MSKDNTPYDDVFRTMASRCSPLLLPLLNETFGTHYTGEVEMTQKVVANLARKQENVAREVNHTMRGPIIMTESSRIFDSGVLVGEIRGEQRGICNSIDIAMSMGANPSEAIQRVARQYKMDMKEVKEIWENRPE